MSALVEAILRDIREGADESRALNEPGGTASWGKEHGILLTRDAAESLFAEVARLRARAAQMETAMRSILPTCEAAHHAKRDWNHEMTACPVVQRYNAALEATTPTKETQDELR